MSLFFSSFSKIRHGKTGIKPHKKKGSEPAEKTGSEPKLADIFLLILLIFQ